jgi:hypothetical protein
VKRRGLVAVGKPRPRHLAEFNPDQWPLALDEREAWEQWLAARRMFAAADPDRWGLDEVDTAREVRRERLAWRGRRAERAAASASRYRPAAEGRPE